MKKIILIVSLVELIIISVLIVDVYKKKNDVLGAKVSINPINKENLIFPEQGNLKYFYEPKPNTHRTDKPAWLPSDYAYKATINADGFNERFNYSIEKNSDVFRIVTLGDSFTFGLYVNTNENYPERLEDLLNKQLKCQNIKKFEVINLGVGGYDIEYSVNRFKERGQKYNPDLVLWLLKDDDFYPPNELLSSKKKQYEKEIKADATLLNEFYKKGSFYPWVGKAVQEVMAELGEDGVLNYNRKALDRINNFYKGRLIFMAFPGFLNNSYLLELQDFIHLRSEASIFDGLSNNYDHFVDWHPTSKGYEQIASEIFDYIKSNRLIPCD